MTAIDAARQIRKSSVSKVKDRAARTLADELLEVAEHLYKIGDEWGYRERLISIAAALLDAKS